MLAVEAVALNLVLVELAVLAVEVKVVLVVEEDKMQLTD